MKSNFNVINRHLGLKPDHFGRLTGADLSHVSRFFERATLGILGLYASFATLGTIGAALRYYLSGDIPARFTFHAISAYGLGYGIAAAAIAGALAGLILRGAK